MYPRFVIPKIEEALRDTPVVMIAGPRQCGKTTLAKQLTKGEGWTYISFDDLAQLQIAKNDPVAFIRNLPSDHVVLDEVQRVPELFICIKQSVDENRRSGRFLLTGSANALLLPKLSDSLAGRMEVIPLFPLSECEIRKKDASFISDLFARKAPQAGETRVRQLLIEKVLVGGFPEPLSRSREARRSAWYVQYVNSLVRKDLREITNIEHLELIPHFLHLLSNHAGQIANLAEIAGKIGLSRQTAVRYLGLLEQLFLIEKLPAWYRNENKRLVKTPKIHVIDTGLLCALRRVNNMKINKNPDLFGHLVECYVFCELKRQTSWSNEMFDFFHYRDKDKVEVDMVIQNASGGLIGIEVKTGATLNKKNFQGLERLKNMAGDDFIAGALLYDGDHTTAFGEGLFAVPIGAIWS